MRRATAVACANAFRYDTVDNVNFPRHGASFENDDPHKRERVGNYRSERLHGDADGRRHRTARGCPNETETAK